MNTKYRNKVIAGPALMPTRIIDTVVGYLPLEAHDGCIGPAVLKIGIALINVTLFAGGVRAASPASVTVPMIVDHARTVVVVTFPRPDGSRREAKMWIATGDALRLQWSLTNRPEPSACPVGRRFAGAL